MGEIKERLEKREMKEGKKRDLKPRVKKKGNKEKRCVSEGRELKKGGWGREMRCKGVMLQGDEYERERWRSGCWRLW